MGLITVNVWDATGNKRQEVQMPDDAPLNRILAVLLEKMRFPQYGPDGQLLSYKFHHRASGRQLLESQTLAESGVKDGDVLRLMPEITAGGIDACHLDPDVPRPLPEIIAGRNRPHGMAPEQQRPACEQTAGWVA